GRYALIRTEKNQWLAHRMKDQSAPARSAAFPRDLQPMLATLGDVDDLAAAEWAFEGKWDGIRAIAEVCDGTVRLRTRSDRDVTQDYPVLGDLARVLEGHNAVLDGEVVAVDRHGGTSFP